MSLRRSLAALALLGALACSPSVQTQPPPTPPGASGPAVDYAVFDPTGVPPAIPLPNDLALQPTSIAGACAPAQPPCANKDLLSLFAANGGFPNDQETPITIGFQRQNVDTATGKVTPTAPDLDLTSLKQGTMAVIAVPADPTQAAPADIETPQAADYQKSSTQGTLTLHNKADATTHSRAWKAGYKYVVALRGGANGVKTAGGGAINPMPVTYLLTRGEPLTSTSCPPSAKVVPCASPAYVALIPGADADAKAAAAQQLEGLRQAYLPAFQAAAAAGIPTQEIALIQTFTIAPAAGPAVVTDASAGEMPLPSDFLIDPATHKVVNNPAFGALAGGIATLDGFSTTAMIISQVSAPVVAATVNAGSVFLYDLSGLTASTPTAPARVKEVKEGAGAGFVAEPYVITRKADGTTPCAPTDDPTGCFSTILGLQPATLVSGPPALASLPPLKEGTEYAVIVTDGVLAAPTTAGGQPAPLKRSTLSSILLFDTPLADASGKSLLAGQPDATAAALERMRQAIGATVQALSAEKSSIAKSNVVLAYTFKTQTITQPALQLAAAPYQNAAAFVPGTFVAIPPAAYPVPAPAAQEILSIQVPTLNPIDVQTGALEPDPTKWQPAQLNGLLVVPQAAAQPVPLVVFQHGLGRTKNDLFAIANTLATAGFVVAAIDAPLHGERAYCTADTDCTCPPSASSCTATCTFFGPAGLQGDAMQIGSCAAPSVPAASMSGKFFVTGNLFRTRDALRQDLLDTSALVLALAPLGAPSNALATELAGKGVTIDPTKVYWIGQSLGGILGTLNTAANPRISRAVLNVPGATLVDIFTSSPAFSPQLDQLLASLTPPISRTQTPAAYLQFTLIAKMILDGADPANFGPHLLGDAAHPTLPDLLQKQPNQAAKNVFAQYAWCDQVIPNAQNLFLINQIGLAHNTGPNGYTAYTVGGAATPPQCAGANPATDPAHGFLLNGSSATAAGQGDAAAYLLNLTVPASDR